MEVFEQSFIELLGKYNRTGGQAQTGKVKSVDGDRCVIERPGLPDLEDVRLNALVGDFEDVFLIVPSIGSEVLYLQVEGRPEENCIVKYTDVDRIYARVDDGVLQLEKGKFIIKNKDSDLKKILAELFAQLTTAIIQTPSGPGNFSPADVQKFEKLKTDTNKLFE